MANVENAAPLSENENEDADTPDKKETDALKTEGQEGETTDIAVEEGASKEEAAEGTAENDAEEGEEEEQDDEEDPFEHLDLNDEDNEEEQSLYKEYLSLIKEINCQNGIIQELKDRSNELKQKKCRSGNESQELQRLRMCQEQENIRLRTMINRAVQLQNFGSRRLYGEVELEITESEQTVFLAGVQFADVQCPSSSVGDGCQLDSDSDWEA
ncbi:acidic leucine-rich nuclear phosphoprotein 32 family member B [Drosophila obscura]|uniref:acidic leucine-rich nuclear phosphoprotein 32 family member B n=1 Tax=Drosophila obscura TaxID=7282 RepID=UPI001BB2A653|nr:acidic leucine-rich nuclear phosphoprotein 32 family member B [Drosophila obscura]